MTKTWVVAADAARARILEAENRSGNPLREIDTWVNPELRLPGREQVTDRPGRGFDQGGEGRHAMDDPTDIKEVESDRFARELMRWLGQAHQEGRFQHLVVAAAPHFLGQLRHHLDGTLKQAVTSEINKDVSRLDKPDQIRKHLPDFLY